MLKTKNKLIIIAFIFVAICLLNVNKVSAVEVTEENLQKMLDTIPEEMEIELAENEFSDIFSIIKKNIIQLLEKNGFDIKSASVQIYSNEKQLNKIEVELSKDIKRKNKIINIKFNYQNKYNENDNTYVKNIEIPDVNYWEINLEQVSIFYEDNTKNILSFMESYYKNLIKDNSITIKTYITATGTHDGFIPEMGEGGCLVGIFKNGVLYKSKCILKNFVPVVTIPATIKNEELDTYVINKIRQFRNKYEPWAVEQDGENIVSIKKGAKINNISIENGYTVLANNNVEIGAIIVKKDISDNTIIKNDENSNIKLEANSNIIPSNTIMEVTPILEGENYNNIKTVLSDVSKFVAYDITLKSNGVEIQPNGNVKISIPIPEGYNTSKLVVYRIEEDGTKVEYKVNMVTIDSKQYAQFETDHFSNYVLTETQETTVTNQREKDNTPKTGTIDIINYVLVVIAIAVLGIVLIEKKSK